MTEMQFSSAHKKYKFQVFKIFLSIFWISLNVFLSFNLVYISNSINVS